MDADLLNRAKQVIRDRKLTALEDSVAAGQEKRGAFSVSIPSRDCTNLLREIHVLCTAIDRALEAEKKPPKMHLFILDLVPDLTQLFHLVETGLLLKLFLGQLCCSRSFFCAAS